MQHEARNQAADRREGAGAEQNRQKQLRRSLAQFLAKARADELDFAVPFSLAAEVLHDRLFLWVDPASISRQFRSVASDGEHTFRVANYFVGSGEWARFLRPLRDFGVYRETHDLLRLGQAFRDAPSYHRMIERMNSGHPDRRIDVVIDSQEKIDHYYQGRLALIESIRKNGVQRRQVNRLTDLAGIETGPSRSLLSEIVERDIGIAIGADGQLHRLCSGQHRFAAAKLMGIKRIPAEIRMIHVTWLRRFMGKRSMAPMAAVIAALEEAGKRSN